MSRAESASPSDSAVLLVAARVLAPVVILTVFGLLFAGVIPVSPLTWVATGVLLAGAVAAVSDSLGAWDTAGVPRRVFAAMSVMLVFVLYYYLFSRLLATKDDWGLAVIIAFLLAGAVALGIGLGMPRVRRRWLGEPGEDSDQLTGVLGPFAWLAVLIVIMTSVFASVTLFAAEKDLISLTAAGVDLPSFEQIAQLYVWQDRAPGARRTSRSKTTVQVRRSTGSTSACCNGPPTVGSGKPSSRGTERTASSRTRKVEARTECW